MGEGEASNNILGITKERERKLFREMIDFLGELAVRECLTFREIVYFLGLLIFTLGETAELKRKKEEIV